MKGSMNVTADTLREGDWIEVSGKGVQIKEIKTGEHSIQILCGPSIRLVCYPRDTFLCVRREDKGRALGVNVMAQELVKGDWVEIDGEPRKIRNIVLTPIDRHWCLDFSGGGSRTFRPTEKVFRTAPADPKPAVTLEQFAAHMRARFSEYVRASQELSRSDQERHDAAVAAAGIAEMWFYLLTGTALYPDTREEFTDFLQPLWAEALV